MCRLRILRAEPLYQPSPPPGGGGSGGGGGACAAVELSDDARRFLASLLRRDWRQRVSAEEALREPWLAPAAPPRPPRPPEGAAAARPTHGACSGGGDAVLPPSASFDVNWDDAP